MTDEQVKMLYRATKIALLIVIAYVLIYKCAEGFSVIQSYMTQSKYPYDPSFKYSMAKKYHDYVQDATGKTPKDYELQQYLLAQQLE